MAAREIDSLGGVNYGKWYLNSLVSVAFNTAAVAATDVLPDTSVAGVTYPGTLILETGILRVVVAENTGVVFNLNLTRVGVTSLMSYNAGVALAANSLYVFDVPVVVGDVVNFQFAVGTTILMMSAYMVLMMGA